MVTHAAHIANTSINTKDTVHVYVYVHVHVYVCECACACVYLNKHTCMHTHIQTKAIDPEGGGGNTERTASSEAARDATFIYTPPTPATHFAHLGLLREAWPGSRQDACPVKLRDAFNSRDFTPQCVLVPSYLYVNRASRCALLRLPREEPWDGPAASLVTSPTFPDFSPPP